MGVGVNTSFISSAPEGELSEVVATTESKASDLIEKVNFQILGADSKALGQKIIDMKNKSDSLANHYVEYAEQYEKAKNDLNLPAAVENLYLFEMALHSNEPTQLLRLKGLTEFFSEKDSDAKNKAVEANDLIKNFLKDHPVEVHDDRVVFAK